MHAPFVVLPDTPVGAALELLERNGIYAVPVVDRNQYLLGLITRELLMADRNELSEMTGLDLRRAADVMYTEVDAVGETDILGTAFCLLINERSPCLLVLDSRGHVVGMLAESDILEVSRHE
ncbi:CBS domain-containing protein [Paraburkholderia sp. SIMBA_049]